MEFIFKKPENKILREYIEGYYVIDKNTNIPSRYFTFPNNYIILSFLHNASVEKIGDKIKIFETPGKSTLSLSTNYVQPWEVHYLDKIDEITIYFKPFGIHQFFEDAGNLFKTENVLEFEPGDGFKGELELILNGSNNVSIDLEQYLLSKFVEKKDDLLFGILQELDGNETVENIARKLDISRQYLTKYFKKQIGKNISEYRKISRFRNALKGFKNQPDQTFTQLTYDYLFFDQSHLIKDFKKLTSHNPKTFFEKVNLDIENVWLTI